MSTVAAFFVFVLIMLALATLAIILDWMGKPIRRAFRPRTAGTPAWLAVDAPLPPQSPASGPAGHSGGQPGGMVAGSPLLEQSAAAEGQPGGMVAGSPPLGQSVSPDAQPVEPRALNPAPDQGEPPALGPWQAGDSIFKPTPRGAPPSITAVRRRYWKNLSEHRASVVFGEANRALMAIGEAPQRFNPRTGAMQEMTLPEPMLRQCWSTGRKPSPTWDDQGLDPYAGP
ncbi:hypothetical protein [Candidatus Poriferisocius sp.]|uniref:hypothetical protein n=1 Tax=Candidatus Poriferisocius sp. TaxID=3101276 RepID=UPI003B01440A